MTNLAKIERLALQLYGPRWQAGVARATGVHPRQVLRWLGPGASQPTDAHVLAMVREARASMARIARAIEMIEEEAGYERK